MNFESLHYFLRIILIKMIKNSGTVSGFKPAHCYSASVAACHVRPADQPTGPWPGGPVQLRRQPAAPERGARGGGAARLVRVLRRTRCPRKGGVSTMRAATTRLMRWRRRGLTRAAARRAGAERRRRGDVPRCQWRFAHGWHRWRGPAVPEGKGEGEAHATCEPRRTEDRLTEEAETRCRGWLSLPVARR
jgi:hypothetical protein